MAGRGDDPDAELVAGAIAGDRAAVAALLQRHYDRIHGLAWQLTQAVVARLAAAPAGAAG